VEPRFPTGAPRPRERFAPCRLARSRITEEAERERRRQKLGSKPLAIIADRKVNQSASVSTALPELWRGRGRMNIGKDFLKDAKTAEGWARCGKTSAVGRVRGGGNEFRCATRISWSCQVRAAASPRDPRKQRGAAQRRSCGLWFMDKVDAADQGGDALIECTPGLGRAGAVQRGQGFENRSFKQRESIVDRTRRGTFAWSGCAPRSLPRGR